MRFAIPLCGSFFCRVTPYGFMGWNRALQKNIFSSSEKMFFFAHAWTASNPPKIYMWIDLGTWNIVFPNNLKKTQTSPALQKKNQALFCFFGTALVKLRQARLCQKHNFSGSKKCCFGTALVKLRKARLCKKKQALKHCFLMFSYILFRMSLVKSANSTSLPRFSSLQIAQSIQYITIHK